jgi:hypothetical protein
MFPYQINSMDDVPRAIEIALALGSIGFAELLRGLRDGEIALLNVALEYNTTFERWFGATAHCPAIALLADDDGLDRGPNGWAITARMLRWARCLMIHAAVPEREHYRAAITAAQLHRRVGLIECSAATTDGWLERVAAMPVPPPVLLILPEGDVHPVTPDQGDVH